MTAQEARELAEKAEEPEYVSIMEKIESSAKNKEYFIKVENGVSYKTQQRLINDGYKVSHFIPAGRCVLGLPFDEISWKP